MKKLFTLFVAMAMITMSFAQISPKPVYALDEPVSLDQRSLHPTEFFCPIGWKRQRGDMFFVTSGTP